MLIKRLRAREVLDSRGKPTLEVELWGEEKRVWASVPAGASRGKHEAVELRDGEKRYFGLGVRRAVKNVNEVIAPELEGKSFSDQRELDEVLLGLDRTPNKSKLGANALLAVSLAFLKLLAAEEEKPLYAKVSELVGKEPQLPIPLMNVINGGKHAGNDLKVQEHLYIPSAKDFPEALRIGVEAYHQLGSMLEKAYGKSSRSVGDEGGFAPPLRSSEEALELMTKALEELGYEREVGLGIDAAASEFYDEASGTYFLDGNLSAEGLLDYYSELASKFKLVSLEDPFAQDDWKAWRECCRKLGKKLQVVGDDLLATNPARIERAIEERACNCLLLKVNQVGTLTEAFEAFEKASGAGWRTIVSHRSGETEDTFIADLAVGLGCGQIKAGAPARGERVCKYNRLLRISEEVASISRPFW